MLLLPVVVAPTLARRPTRAAFGVHRNRVGHNGVYSVVSVHIVGGIGALTRPATMVRGALRGSGTKLLRAQGPYVLHVFNMVQSVVCTLQILATVPPSPRLTTSTCGGRLSWPAVVWASLTQTLR